MKESATKKDKIKKYVRGVFFINLVGNIIGHVITIVLGVPIFKHCYNVALIVMTIGPVLGFIQVILYDLYIRSPRVNKTNFLSVVYSKYLNFSVTS